MTRDLAFIRADIDTGFMHDMKVVALARHQRNPALTATTLTLYLSLVLESWENATRLTIEETIPAWWMDPIDDLAADLCAVGLIDDEHRVPAKSWSSWFDPAAERRIKAKRSAIFGGLRSRGFDPKEANREADRRAADMRLAYGLPAYKPQPNRLNLEAQPHTSPYQPSQQGMRMDGMAIGPAPEGAALATEATSAATPVHTAIRAFEGEEHTQRKEPDYRYPERLTDEELRRGLAELPDGDGRKLAMRAESRRREVVADVTSGRVGGPADGDIGVQP